MAKSLIKTIYKSSRWCKLLLVLIILLIFFIGSKASFDTKEGFINQTEKFKMIDGPKLYDGFYSKIYDDLVFDKVKNEYEVGEIINSTQPTLKSLILDVGSGTGDHVAKFTEKNLKAVGLDSSPAMVTVAKQKYPNLDFTLGSATNVMIYPAHTFTHITCLNFTLYYIKEKYLFFRNCYEWLKPGGYLVIHLVDRNRFDPVLNSVDPISGLKIKKYANQTATTSVINFNDYQYKAQFGLDKANNTAVYEETFTDPNKKSRKQIHRLYMPEIKTILQEAKNAGFVVQSKIDLAPVEYEYQYLYVLYKPE